MWRYILTRVNGDGTETPLHWDVPLSSPQITEYLSGPGGIGGTITPEIQDLKDDNGRPLIVPYATAIYAEQDGHIRGGAIVTDPTEQSGSLALDSIGFSGYIAGMPYFGEQAPQIQVDPLNMARHIWAHAQSRPMANIGLVLDSTTSPVRIGTKETDVNFTTGSGDEVSFQSGPYQLADWKTSDLGKEFDDLAKGTPFEYRVDHAWIGGTDQISHRMRIGYPRIGRTRHDLRFVVGENLTVEPPIDYASDDYANGVLVLGAGEGRKMVRAYGEKRDGRLLRVAVVTDNSITSKAAANTRVALELRRRQGLPVLGDTITVADHDHAPFGSYDVGDEILIETGDEGWSGYLATWCRILSITLSPEDGTAKLSVANSEQLGR